ncbi:MAG TPA: ATP-binding protein [Polyangia bacterium]|nr:ATP-binding protein [Polyangia bacterium]
MTLGTRVTVVTTLLVASVLAGSGYAALKVRRANLEADLDREAHEIATALRAGLEPLHPATAEETLVAHARAAHQHDELFQLEVLSIGADKRTDDDAWLLLMRAADIQDQPVGRVFDSSSGPRSYAMAVPLFDQAALELPARHPARHPIAIMGIRRNAGYIDAEVAATARRIYPLFLLVVIGVAIGVRFAIEQIAVRPLRRLLEGIDAVGKGDLSRVLLAERDDEIGTLAGRFNAMTGSLREAREETERAASARLGLEARLRQSEKLATIGQMAAEIAHELGTPLNVIGGRARAMAKKAEKALAEKALDRPAADKAGPDAGEVVKNATIIGDEVSRITKIIRQVLDFSRPRGPTVTRVHLGAVVAESLEFLREAIRGQGIEVDVHTMPAPPEVPGDPDQIQQVCLNLIMNAIHAMPNGGTLRIATDRMVRRKGGLDLAPPAEYAALIVADTGPGIPAADRDKIFEPFFTTKDEGQGTGLGLAVSHGIVKDHDGWIEVENPPTGGAEFRVYLPCASAESSAAFPAAPLAEMRSIGKD